MSTIKLTVLAPVYNEEKVIEHFYRRTRAVLDDLDNVDAEILFVVDRSSDNTLAVLRKIVAQDPKARVLALSSRFGHQMSLLAGITNAADADAIVMMDSDLQHPPELIPELLVNFRRGCEVVYTVRRDTQEISSLRKFSGNLFYKLLGKLSQIPINANAADFRLISQRVGRIITTEFGERNMFLRGLFTWIGFQQIGIEYTAEKRFAGESKYSFSRTMQLAMAGILSFSTKPLQASIFIGLGFASLAFLCLLLAIGNYFIDRTIPSGWTTVVVLLLLFSGVQLIVLGIMGSYLGGIYEQVKNRPRFIIEEEISQHGR